MNVYEMSRVQLERQADRLGLPWTHVTTDAQLRELLSNNQEGSDMKQEVRREGDKLFIGEHEQPGCFGLYWIAGVDDPEADDCKECMFGPYCFEQMSMVTLPAVISRMPKNSSFARMAEEMGVPEEAVKECYQNYISKQDIGSDEDPVEEPPVEEPIAEEAPDDGPGLEALLPPEEPKPNKRKKEKKRKTQADKLEDLASGRPTRAGSAKSAKGPAKPKTRKKSSATAAVAREETILNKTKGEWSQEHNPQRWKRERDRSALIAALIKGDLLKREWQGANHEVQVLDQGYKYKGKVYPTLYSITKLITGTKATPRKDSNGNVTKGKRQLCSWSAARFWKLKHFHG